MDRFSIANYASLKRFTSFSGILVFICLLSVLGSGNFARSANAVDLNHSPVCANAYANIDSIWPPNHKFTPIEIQGVTDSDGDSVEIAIQCILQDEKLNTTGDGNTEYDGDGINTSVASVRSERSGNQNGRVYHIDFIATDSHGARCGGEVTVAVNHDKKSPAIDEGRLYQSVPTSNTCGLNDINNPPIIYSTPVTFSQSWEPYQYDVEGHDPDGDVLQYTLINAPAGMTIDSAGGMITWQNPAPGEQNITVQVDDNRGETDQQTYTLFVNGPPVITSMPLGQILATSTYQYQVVASDPNSDRVTYRLTQFPEGMSIDEASGQIHWIPTLEQVGVHSVNVSVDDNRGGTNTQTWDVKVLTPNYPPKILNTLPPYAAVGLLYQYQVKVTDPDGNTLSYSLLTHPEGMSIDETSGVISWSPTSEQLGKNQVVIQVADGHGGIDKQSGEITVIEQSAIDLEPINLDVSNLTIDPQTLQANGSVVLDIRNNGIGYFASGYEVMLFEDTNHNGTYDTGDKILATTQVKDAQNGGETISLAIELHAQVAFRDNLIYVFVDSAEKVEELNEENNIINNRTNCEFKPPVGSFNPVLKWEWTNSPIKSGYNQVMSTPVVANLHDDNGDGQIDSKDIPDIIFNTFAGGNYNGSGYLRAIKGDGSGELFTVTDYPIIPISSPAVADIDNDGKVEIIDVDAGRKIAVFKNDGTLKWISPSLKLASIPYINVADLDQDGKSEIISGSTVLNNDGSAKWTGVGYDHSVVVDLNFDGKLEVFNGNTAYNAQGSILWTNSQIPIRGFSAFANFNDDPYPELVVVSQSKVYLLSHTGEKIWGPIALPGGGGGPPTIADYDNDGKPEVGIAGASRYVVFETDGTIRWQQTTQDYSSASTGSSVFDFEGDGSAEVVYSDERYLRIYRGSDGEVLFQTPVGSGTLNEYPLIVDVDNDNNAEIIVPSNNYYIGPKTGIQVYGDANDTWVNTRKIWNQHAYSITNVNDDGTIPRVVANNWDTFNNFRQNQMLKALGCQDISASSLRLDQENFPQSVSLLARIGNSSALDLAPGIKVAFYNGDPQNGGILIGTTTIDQRLNPGQYVDVTIPWASPAPVSTEIYVRADDGGTGKGIIFEVDEDNNVAHFTVIPGNRAPHADAGEDRTIFAGKTTTLEGAGSSDPENAPLTFQWTLVEAPTGSTAALSEPTSVTPTLATDKTGTYLIQLVVNDGVQPSGISTVHIIASPEITVPNLTGLSQIDADALIKEKDLTVGQTSTEFSSSVPKGKVISQTPSAGDIVTLETPVNLVISAGIQMVAVPNVIGMTKDEAKATLSASTLITGSVDEQYINISSAGLIFQQTPAPRILVPANSAVNLQVSLGIWTGTDTEPPQVRVEVTPEKVDLGQTATITVWTADNVGVETVQLLVGGQPITLTGNQVEYVSDKPGRLSVSLTATDAAGLSSTDTAPLVVIDPNDTVPPTVSLTNQDCVDVTTPYSVTGEVRDTSDVYYGLYYRFKGTTEWIPFAQNEGNNNTGQLGVFDPTLLKNGVYELALYGEDLNGNSNVATGCAVVYGKMKLGQVTLPAVDLSQPQPGIPLEMGRIYDSRTTNGDFGPGWSLPSSEITAQSTNTLDGGWGQNSGGGMFTTYYLIEKYRHELVIRLSDEETYRFRMDVTPKSSLLYPIENYMTLKANWVPLDGAQEILVHLDDTGPLMLINSKLYQYGTDPFEPSRFKLTKKDGTQYIINTASGLESVTDVYGHTVSYDKNGIHSSSGASISFQRGVGNRIEKITDQLGMTIEYYYDDDGMLEKLVRSGTEPFAVRTLNNYAYAKGIFTQPVLKEIKAPDETVLGSFEYIDGRISALIDAEGNHIIYGYDRDNNRQDITDRLGNTTNYIYDGEGNVTKKTDPMGNITLWNYDDLGNKLSETDPLGSVTTWTYDTNNNPITETDPQGKTTTYTYNQRNKVLTVTDPNGNITANTYNDKGDLTSTKDPLGNTTGYAYDGNGNLVSMTDALGNTTSYGYDANGNMVSETDPLGNTTLFTYDGYGNQLTSTRNRTTDQGIVSMTTTKVYDSRNRLIKTIDPDGHEAKTEYNLQDKKTADIDAMDERTEHGYDPNGNLTLISYPDGTSQKNTYDAEGNKLSTTDRSGNTTSFAYDSLKRLVSTVHPDGSKTDNQYNVAGRLVQTTDERGNSTIYGYDDAGKRVLVTDALGNETHYGFDPAGNQTSMTDANGNTTTFVYDKANRRISTVFADGSHKDTGYDPLGRKISETDQNSITNQFEYDPLGRLTTVIDALEHTTSYSYDEEGNKLSQTDALGRVTRWNYDNNGNILSHTLPLGQVEYFTYDPVGKQISHTDFNGDTTGFTYSPCCGRLLQKLFPDGSSESYTYTGTGQIRTVVNQLGTTAYTYDQRDRVIQVDNPDNTFIAYTYDAAGNRLSVTTPASTTTYGYDALNRLSKVTDQQNQVTSYSYDAVGNRASVQLPNGIATTYTYDRLNRLVHLENQQSGTVVSAYDYTLGPAGNRLRVTESSGLIVDYSYDSLSRLVEEQISNPATGASDILYSYDDVGNRLTKSVDGLLTDYSYDANDRLLTAGSASYSYDADGNQTGKTDATGVTAYSYDYQNRLVQARNAAETIDYAYNHNGIRVAKDVNGQETRYLIDANRPYAQVLEEYELNQLAAIYTYGDNLISQYSNNWSFYLYDGQLSTRQLTDKTGTVTDSYTYDAFGNQLAQTGSTINFYRYTGEQYDPNVGFYYLRARYMDPVMGRFVTQDSWEGDTFEPPSLHLYVYTHDNPVNYIDPSGHFFSIMEFSVSNAINSNLRKSNDANRAFKAYKNVRKGLCTVAGVAATNSHHAVPMFLGGKKYPGRTNMIPLSTNFHREFHLLLHYMLRMADFPGGMGSGASKAAYEQLFQSNPATRAAAHQVLILAARIFDDACTKQGAPPITPTIRAQIQAGKWDF